MESSSTMPLSAESFLRGIKDSNRIIDDLLKSMIPDETIPTEEKCDCYCNDCFIGQSHYLTHKVGPAFVECKECLSYFFHIATCRTNKCSENHCVIRKREFNIILDIFLDPYGDYSAYCKNADIQKIVKWSHNGESCSVRYIYILILMLQEKIQTKQITNYQFMFEQIDTYLTTIENIIIRHDSSFIPIMMSEKDYTNTLLKKLYNLRLYLIEDWSQEKPLMSTNDSVYNNFKACLGGLQEFI